MPLFSSLSIRESNTHPNKLEKSPHSRRASLGGIRKASVSRKGALDEDASTRAVAGSNSRLLDNNKDPNPMTPTSLVGDPVDHPHDPLVDQTEMRDRAPTPPPHDDDAYMGDADLADPTQDAGNRDSTHSASTWRAAMRNQGAHNGVHGLTTDSDPNDQRNNYGLTGDRTLDLATARAKVKAAIEAELAADRAIEVARKAVIEARMVVGAIEKQAIEEFERAHHRRLETAGVVKELEKLGRHNK